MRELLADIRARAYSVFHPCGSVRMGRDPATSAVDPALRVHGLARCLHLPQHPVRQYQCPVDAGGGEGSRFDPRLTRLLRLKPQQAQQIQRYQHRRTGIGQDRDPETGHPEHRSHEENRLQPQRQGDILVNIRHSGAGKADLCGDIRYLAAQNGRIGHFQRHIGPDPIATPTSLCFKAGHR